MSAPLTNNFFVRVFARIWAAWALVLFLATMLIAIFFYLPCFLLKDPVKVRWHRQVSRIWMSLFLTLIGCPLRVKGKAHFQKGQAYIVVCNHNSLMDVPVSTPFMHGLIKPLPRKVLYVYRYSDGSIHSEVCWLTGVTMKAAGKAMKK